MGDFVGVDPANLRQLADRLSDLASVLAKDGALIKSTMTAYNSQLDYSVFARDSAQDGDDSSSFRKRADLAIEMNRQPHYSAVGPYQIPGWGTVFPPGTAGPLGPNEVRGVYTMMSFDMGGQSGTEGVNDAHDLANALKDPGSALSKQIFAEVGQAVADHSDDPAYLQAFYANGGLASSEQIAAVLRGNDGGKIYGTELISPDSQHLVALYAQGLAAASTMQGKGQIPAGTIDMNSFSHLSDPKDMWSATMLMKYGPSGDQWDPQFLANAGTAVLKWRHDHMPPRPDYSAPKLSGAGYIPGGYVQNDKLWYQDLGLSVDYISVDGDDVAKRVPAIDANDPALAVLGKIGDNTQASRLLLADPNHGADNAAALVDYHWQTPGPVQFDDSSIVGKVITNATISDRKDFSQLSATAAANIIHASANEYNTEKGLDDNTKSQWGGGLPTPLSNALREVYIGYIPDLSKSSTNFSGDSAHTLQLPDDPNTWIVGTGIGDMRGFMSLIMQNTDNANAMTAATQGYIAKYSSQDINSEGIKAYLQNLAELNGNLAVAGQAVKYNAAAHQDAVNADRIMWLNAVGGFVASVPGVGTLGDWIKAGIWGALPIASSKFSTGNAANANDNAQSAVHDQGVAMREYFLQGMAAAGKIPPPAGHTVGDCEQSTLNLTQQQVDDWWTQATIKDPALTDYYHTVFEEPYTGGSGQYASH